MSALLLMLEMRAMMRLIDLIQDISYEIVQGTLEKEVTELVYDSRKLTKDCVFVCIRGTKVDGHHFVEEAIQKGASVVIAEQAVSAPEYVTVLVTPDTRVALAYLSASYFGYPASKLKTIGITGTKGKTTTACMVRGMLESSGIPTGLIGTVEVDTKKRIIPAGNTTPESYLVQQYFKEMVDAGCQAVVMEVSSQGLKMNRVAGIVFDYGVFTNLEPDHIGTDEHADFEEYASCKALLFRQCKLGIFNADDANVEKMLEGHTCKVETFGIKNEADLRAVNCNLHKKEGALLVSYQTKGLLSMNVEVKIPGTFTIYNSLTAIAIARHFQVQEETIANALLSVQVKGRVELLPISERFSMMIDYAHNAMSLESLLSTLKEYEPKRLVCLFGCGGNRSKDRRFEMGEISSRLADFTIVTSDNPRFEKPEDIIADILVGVKRADGEYVTVPDRKEAIRYSIINAQDGDVIVLAGKGHEDYQEICGVKYPMDERVLVRKIIQEMSEAEREQYGMHEW